MTDQRARAVELRAKLLKDMESRKGFRRDMIDAVTKNEWDSEWDDKIASALADERRRVMEDMLGHLSELAKALPVQHEQPNLGQCTYNWYRHVEKLLRDYAKAHAGQEG